MARRENELFIGREHLNIEGRAIKHPALIKYYATLNINKVNDDKIQLMGLDLETDHKTAELKLMGFWNGLEYHHYYNDNWVEVLFRIVKACEKADKSLVYWNRLDPFVIFKQFLYLMTDDEITNAMAQFGKIAGEWNKKTGVWEIPPVTEVSIGGYKFGIKNAIRSSIQFFYYRNGDTYLNTVWAYDVAQLYQNGLEKEALKHLTYYSKVDKSVHLVDWVRYDNDYEYQKLVLYSNYLDSRAVYDLGYIIQEQFKTAFKYYPRTLISQGSIARSAIVAVLKELHGDDDNALLDDLRAIGFRYYYDEWLKQYGEDTLKDLYALSMEAYSGGQIEAYMFGYAKEAYTADLASAYPSIIEELYDLRNCKITKGSGEPPHIEKSYCFIRGDVDIPSYIDYHPLTVKHPIHHETNIRPTGEYRASYTIEERDYLIALGAKFDNEEWINFETKGIKSPLAIVSKTFSDLRAKLIAEGNSAQYVAKTANASLYGILYEAVDTYEEIKTEKKIDLSYQDTFYKDILKKYRKSINLSSIKHHLNNKIISMWHNKDSKIYPDMLKQELESFGIFLSHDHPIEIINEIDTLYRKNVKIDEYDTIIESEIIKGGYRAGEFFNPIFATIITSRTRIKIARACQSIKEAGGKPVLVMTDSVFFTGKANMIPADMVRDPKTTGYFETPTKINNLVCLGSGRYGYVSEKGYMQAKKRGLNATEIHDPDGIQEDEFNWLTALKIMRKTKEDKINITVRVLISVGMVLNNHSYTWRDLGRVVEEIREVEVIVGKSKRVYDEDLKNPELLNNQLVETQPIYLARGMLGDFKLNDQTLPQLRMLMNLKHCVSGKEKRRKNVNKASKKYHDKHKSKVKQFRNNNYIQLREYGYNSYEARLMQSWSIEKIQLKLMEDQKL